jgi:hypothetical protein
MVGRAADQVNRVRPVADLGRPSDRRGHHRFFEPGLFHLDAGSLVDVEGMFSLV